MFSEISFGDYVLGATFIQGRVTAHSYTEFWGGQLQDLDTLPLSVTADLIFQQDGHPAHTSNLAVAALNNLLTRRCIGARGLREWPPWSPVKSIMDFFF